MPLGNELKPIFKNIRWQLLPCSQTESSPTRSCPGWKKLTPHSHWWNQGKVFGFGTIIQEAWWSEAWCRCGTCWTIVAKVTVGGGWKTTFSIFWPSGLVLHRQCSQEKSIAFTDRITRPECVFLFIEAGPKYWLKAIWACALNWQFDSVNYNQEVLGCLTPRQMWLVWLWGLYFHPSAKITVELLSAPTHLKSIAKSDEVNKRSLSAVTEPYIKLKAGVRFSGFFFSFTNYQKAECISQQVRIFYCTVKMWK